MAAPPPPPGYFDPNATPTVPPQPPPGYTSAEDPSFWGRLGGTQPGPVVASPTPDQGRLLPLRRGANGIEFDPYAGVLGSILRAITTPGDVALGRVPTPYETGVPNPDLITRAGETAGVMSPMSPAYRAGSRFGTVTPLADDAWLPRWRGNLTTPSLAAPATKEISDAADKGYTAVRGSGWEVPSTAVETVANDTTRTLRKNFTPISAPNTFDRLETMASPEYSSTSVNDLMSHYDALTGVIKGGGPDAKAAYAARDAVSQMLSNLQAHGATPAPGVTPTMTPAEVGTTLETARGNARAAASANRISGDLNEARKGIVPESEAAQNIGGLGFNLDRNLRARTNKILSDNANVAALQPDEKAALEGVADGTWLRNTLRNIGSIFGVTNPVRAIASTTVGGAGGAAVGLPELAAILPAAGTVAGATASGMTRRALTAAEELIRRNSPLAQSQLDALQNSYSPGIGRDQAVIRALLPGLLAPPPPEPRGRGLLVPPPPPGFI